MGYDCPVCGYPDLEEPPYNEEGYGSFEICPNCGFQFGYDDGGKFNTERIHQYRHRWLEKIQTGSGYICPVCGYPRLKEPPYNEEGYGSKETCPICGFQFGYHDGGKINIERIRQYRHKWLKGREGLEWLNKKNIPPEYL